MVPKNIQSDADVSRERELLERIKTEILFEYDRLGAIDVADWVGKYPAQRDEIIDFWMWVKGTPRDQEMDLGPFDSIDSDIAEDGLKNACLAINLGPQWLEAPLDPNAAALNGLATAMEGLRRQPLVTSGQAPVEFRKAVLLTWIVSLFQRKRPQVTRLAVQKATYLLESALNLGVFLEHNRKPLGPYDSRSKYRDAEPIAKRRGWLVIDGTILRVRSEIPEVMRFVPRYVRSQNLAHQFVCHLAQFPDDELEVLATVHWTAKELAQRGVLLNVATIIDSLASSHDWGDKLQRPAFSVDGLGKALLYLKQLRLIAI